MKQKIYKIFKIFLKNFIAFLVGGVLSVPITLLLARPLLESALNKDVGLGVIVLAPALILIYSILFGIAGGIAGIIIYNLIKFFKRKKRASNR